MLANNRTPSFYQPQCQSDMSNDGAWARCIKRDAYVPQQEMPRLFFLTTDVRRMDEAAGKPANQADKWSAGWQLLGTTQANEGVPRSRAAH